MRKLALTVLSVALFATLSFASGKGQKTGKAKTFSGEIFDSQCAMVGSHEKMEKMNGIGNDSKMCTQKCVEMGGKYVLYNAAKKATYQLDDQDKPKEFAGQKVKVTGTYDRATKTIHVQSIEAGS